MPCQQVKYKCYVILKLVTFIYRDSEGSFSRQLLLLHNVYEITLQGWEGNRPLFLKNRKVIAMIYFYSNSLILGKSDFLLCLVTGTKGMQMREKEAFLRE